MPRQNTACGRSGRNVIMDMNWLLATPVAHRGLHDAEKPENSIPAFRAAMEHGFTIEIDVHLSSDGKLVVFHDDNLKRVCGVDKKVAKCTLAELKSMKLKGTEETIPTFDEFLALVDGKVGILCEIKGLNPYDNSISAAVCERLKTYKGNIALQSFNYGAVRYCRRHTSLPCGQLCTWQNPSTTGRSHLTDFMGKLWINKLSKPHFIAYDVRDLEDNPYIVKARESLPVITWTVNSTEKLERAKKLADNIIFEDICPLVESDYIPTHKPRTL